MFQRIFALTLGAMLALPALAQDAGPLELAPGMRAYTTRVFVAPEVLAGVSVGDEVSFFITHFTDWDFPPADEYVDTYVTAVIAENLEILAFDVAEPQTQNLPLIEVNIRVEGQPPDILDLVTVGYNQSKDMLEIQLIPRIDDRFDPYGSQYIVMVKSIEEQPVYCSGCETITRVEYFHRLWNSPPVCYRTVRRGTKVNRIEVPCAERE